MPVSVIKKDGSRELFDKQKLLTGISRACEKTNFSSEAIVNFVDGIESQIVQDSNNCLLYTSPSPRDTEVSRMPSSA